MAEFKRRTLFLSSGKQIKLFGNSIAIGKSLEIGEGYAPNPDLASTVPRGGAPRTNAPGLGETQIKPGQRSGLRTDMAVQPHNVKTQFREASGSAVQSAHLIPSSAAEEITLF